MRLVSWVFVAIVGGLALYRGAACVLPHGCTEIGCADGVFADLAFADHRWPDGAYEIEIALDDVTHACSFSWPEAQPARGSVSSLRCEPADAAFSIAITQQAECTEQRTADAVSQSCQPLEGQYSLQLSAFGTPKRMQVRVERDGALVAERDLTLTYTASRPNGPDCEPVCRQSSHEIRLD
jgi:hypothetical protein